MRFEKSHINVRKCIPSWLWFVSEICKPEIMVVESIISKKVCFKNRVKNCSDIQQCFQMPVFITSKNENSWMQVQVNHDNESHPQVKARDCKYSCLIS